MYTVLKLGRMWLTNTQPQVFEEGLGTLQGYKAKVHVDPNAQPKFCRARSVLYALREKVEKELARLRQSGACRDGSMGSTDRTCTKGRQDESENLL